jgi:fermentation-respiration switch protein FrsA (DUF1100 family)
MKKGWLYWLRLSVITVTVTLAVITTALAVFGSVEIHKVLHPPRRLASGTLLEKYRIPYQAVDLLTEDGIRLSAWYTPPRKGAVILLAHPYRDHRQEWVHMLLARKGYGVLAWDTRAHGTSDGDTTTIGYSEVLDVKAALQYALAQPGVEHVGGWGGSMGAVTMIRATARFTEIEALFVDSPFPSMDAELNFLLPDPLLAPFAKGLVWMETGIDIKDVDLLKDIATISPRPVYIAQGGADEILPADSAQRLFDAAGDPRTLWVVEGVGHMKLYVDDPARYQRRLVRFYDQWLLGK